MIWRPRAERDLAEAYVRIAADSPAAAERLLAAVEKAVSLLLRHPAAGRAWESADPRVAGIRSWVVRGFEAYLIFCRHGVGDLEIVRFLHGARDLPELIEEVRERPAPQSSICAPTSSTWAGGM